MGCVQVQFASVCGIFGLATGKIGDKPLCFSANWRIFRDFGQNAWETAWATEKSVVFLGNYCILPKLCGLKKDRPQRAQGLTKKKTRTNGTLFLCERCGSILF